MKYIIVVPDGMADEPVEELMGKTPLEVAVTTNMDFMAQNGQTGLVRTIPKGMHPGSDVGNMSLLGFDPKKYHTGRAPLEAANLNIDVGQDEIIFRCNLVTIEDECMSDYSASHIKTEEASILIEALNKELKNESIRFIPGKSYRHLMLIKTNEMKKMCELQTNAPHDILNKPIKNFLPKGEGADQLLELIEKSRSILTNHDVNKVRVDLGENPANMIWLWGQGTKPQLPRFEDKYGLKGGIISAVDLVNGIGRLVDLEVIDVPGITGYYDTNYLGKAEYALKALKNKDFVYIHIEAPDEAGHNGDAKAKVSAIERIDKDILGTILNHYNEHDDVRILVLPDHPTPIRLRTHTDDPVGYIMYGKGISPDGSKQFTEKSAAEKGLKFEGGEPLIEHFIKKYL